MNRTIRALLFSVSLVLAGACGAEAQQNVVVVLDDSGSMDEFISDMSATRMEVAKQALSKALTELPKDTNVGVVTLNTTLDGSHWIVPLGPVDPAVWQTNISRIQPLGGTPLGEYLKVGADALLDARSQKIYGEFRLLVVTDGEANDPAIVDRYLPQILSRGLTIDAIGVDMSSSHSLATRVNNYRDANDNASLEKAIAAVFAETTIEDQDADGGFELLEGLPDGFAEQAIIALTTVNNSPLDSNYRGNNDSVVRTSSRATASTWAGMFLGTACSCVVALVFVIGLILVLATASRKSRR